MGNVHEQSRECSVMYCSIAVVFDMYHDMSHDCGDKHHMHMYRSSKAYREAHAC